MDTPPRFETVKHLPDGRTVEHVHTTFVAVDDVFLDLDEHVVIDGQLQTHRVRLLIAGASLESQAWAAAMREATRDDR